MYIESVPEESVASPRMVEVDELVEEVVVADDVVADVPETSLLQE